MIIKRRRKIVLFHDNNNNNKEEEEDHTLLFCPQLNLASGKSFTIKYLRTIPAQVDKLKDRSTACIQDVTFTKCNGPTVNIGEYATGTAGESI